MSRFAALFFSLFLVFTALAEATHCHEDACDSPCPAVCSGAVCGTCCETTGVAVEPADTEQSEARAFVPALAHRLSDEEIFHPPAA